MTVVFVTLAFLLANAFFVAAEFAVIGVSRASVTNSANRGDSMAARVLGLLTSPVRQDRFIATAQIGITVASLGLGMYGEHTFAAWLEPRLDLSPTARFVASHTLASVLAVAALTYLHIFLGENGAEGHCPVARQPDRAAGLLADVRHVHPVLSVRHRPQRDGQLLSAAGRDRSQGRDRRSCVQR
jgi:hypothetical protein